MAHPIPHHDIMRHSVILPFRFRLHLHVQFPCLRSYSLCHATFHLSLDNQSLVSEPLLTDERRMKQHNVKAKVTSRWM